MTAAVAGIQTAEIVEKVLTEPQHVREKKIQEIFNSITTNRLSLEKLRDEMTFVRDLNVMNVLSSEIGKIDIEITKIAIEHSTLKHLLKDEEATCNLMQRGLTNFIQDSLEVEQKLIPQTKQLLEKTDQSDPEAARLLESHAYIYAKFADQGKSLEKIASKALNQAAGKVYPLFLNWQKIQEHCAKSDVHPFSKDFERRCRLIYLA